jgi:predicted RNase H-like nuclease (RuvC/YqgF family)
MMNKILNAISLCMLVGGAFDCWGSSSLEIPTQDKETMTDGLPFRRAFSPLTETEGNDENRGEVFVKIEEYILQGLLRNFESLVQTVQAQNLQITLLNQAVELKETLIKTLTESNETLTMSNEAHTLHQNKMEGRFNEVMTMILGLQNQTARNLENKPQ